MNKKAKIQPMKSLPAKANAKAQANAFGAKGTAMKAAKSKGK